MLEKKESRLGMTKLRIGEEDPGTARVVSSSPPEPAFPTCFAFLPLPFVHAPVLSYVFSDVDVVGGVG